MLTTKELFSLEHTMAGEWLAQFGYPWQALDGLHRQILTLIQTLNPHEYVQQPANVWIHRTATVADSAFIAGPTIIGPETEIRHCAFIRGDALIGAGCVIGNSVEVKHAILFDGVQVPHFNYVGDSILGYLAHLGAGAITSNVRSDKQNVVIRHGGEAMHTNRMKCGAMIGDRVEVGSNTVLNPGTVIGKGSIVYPLSCVRGTVASGMIWKNAQNVVEMEPEHTNS